MDKKFTITSILSIAALLIIFSVSLLVGSIPLNIPDLLTAGSVSNIVFFSIRLPRVFAALLSGLAFSVSGLLIQRATGNGLSSPNIIGVNSGAGASVLLFLSLAPDMFAILPLAAFLGAIISVSIVFLISSLTKRVSSSVSLILSGVAVNALFNAVISTISSLDPETMASYSAFSIGGFSGIYSSMLRVPALLIIISIALSFLLSDRMDVISLGDEIASSMGYRPLGIRILLIAIASLLAASAVTFSGLLGFVGLVTPHAASFLTSDNSRRTLILSSLIGPSLVMLSDLAGRTIISPSELPAGVFMAIIGVPFFIFLLLRRND